MKKKLAVMALAAATLSTVSYTHLDVYKRQVLYLLSDTLYGQGHGYPAGSDQAVYGLSLIHISFDEDVKRSLASGMNGHLSKPVDIQVLEKTLKKVLG